LSHDQGLISKKVDEVRLFFIASSMLLCPMAIAQADVSIDIGTPNINIGVNVPEYPQMEQVQGLPVYYAPGMNANDFFYDGQYWVYQDNNWYESGWYNGPWQQEGPDEVPLYILRVPVEYYRRPPAYFGHWQSDAPPRWGDHWGHDWQQHHHDWNHWDRNAVPQAAPLPNYQRQFSGDHYPHTSRQQSSIKSQNYHFQPREPLMQHSRQPGQPLQQHQQDQQQHQLDQQKHQQDQQQHQQDQQKQQQQQHQQNQQQQQQHQQDQQQHQQDQQQHQQDQQKQQQQQNQPQQQQHQQNQPQQNQQQHQQNQQQHQQNQQQHPQQRKQEQGKPDHKQLDPGQNQ
jgi:hypothetical protein